MVSLIKRVRFTAHQLSVELTCGMSIAYPLDWFNQLKYAKIEDLKHFRITDNKITWTTLNYEVSLQELLQLYWDLNDLNVQPNIAPLY